MLLRAENAVVRVLWLAIFGCVIALVWIAGTAVAKASSYEDAATGDATRDAIHEMLAPADSGDAAEQPETIDAHTAAFYAARDFKPVWSGDGDAEDRATQVLFVLRHAYEQGLSSDDYTKALAIWKDAPEQGEDAACYDIAVTRALLRYAQDVRLGRLKPGDVYEDVSLPLQGFDAGAALADALRHDQIKKFLAGLPPQHAGYRGLVQALAQYRAIAARGGWPVVPAGADLEKEGRGMTVLARRLAFEDPVLANTIDPSGPDVREALLRFQRRMGLDDDGKLGADTLKALNTPVSVRMQQIAANMERWRWLPQSFERDYIFVNVPDESLDFIHNHESLLHSRVIIGKKSSPTPIMRTVVEAVVTNPPWDIPDDIAAKKLLPHLRQDANYLASRNMVLADGPSGDPHGNMIDWKRVNPNALPYQIQQNPGADNALGALMLDSPNDFGVYMHDTPEKKLFRSDMREMSNGCVRVEEIFALASLALKEDPDSNDDLKEAIASGDTQRTALPDPLPAYMVYWTAIAAPDGDVSFRPDRYGRDARLIAKLAAKPRSRDTVVASAKPV